MTDYTRQHKRLIRIALKMRMVWVGIGLISLLSAVSVIVMMDALSKAVNAVFMLEQSLEDISQFVWILAGATMLRGFFFWISGILAQNAASDIKNLLRIRLFIHIRRLGSTWSERQSSGALASTAVEGVEKLNDWYARFLPAALNMTIVPVIIAIYVFKLDWLSGLILVITGPLIPLFMSLIGNKAQSQTQLQWTTLQRLGNHFLDSFQGMKTLKLFNQTERKQIEIEQISDRFRSSTMGILKIAFLSAFVLELFASIATALVAVEIGIRLIEGHIGFQLGLLVLLLAPEYYLPFRMFGAQHHAGMEGAEAAENIFRILDTQVSEGTVLPEKSFISDGNSTFEKLLYSDLGFQSGQKSTRGIFPSSEKQTDLIAPYKICFSGIRFRYPGAPVPVLEDCSFTLNPGVTTAMVGRSGSGKTTLMRLITRQLRPRSGQIFINGTPLEQIEEEKWLKQLAVVRQDTWLFDDTILANIKMAKPDAAEQEVIDAAKAAEAHHFICKLPMGYHTGTGEQGIRFSGGEKQRMAIARAFLKNAPIILFDEPSSALDPESEAAINTAMKRLQRNRILLVIAHRLSTVRNADHIMVLENGRISHFGDHLALMQNSTLYHKLTISQVY